MKQYRILLSVLCSVLCVGCGTQEIVEPIEEMPVLVESLLEVEGEVEARKSEEIYIEFPAKIKEVNIMEGDIVDKGTPLFTLDTASYESTIKVKEGNIAVMEAELKALEQKASTALLEITQLQQELKVKQEYMDNQSEPDIKVLQTDLELARQDLENMQEDYKINQVFYESGSISKKELTNLEQKINAKESEIKNIETNIEKIDIQAQLSISQLKSEIEVKQMKSTQEDKELANNIEVTKLKIEVAKQELDILKNQIKGVYIEGNQLLASRDNLLIYDIQHVAGSQITNNTQLLARCVELGDLIVTISIPTEDLSRVEIGDEVRLEVYTDQESPIMGVISRISNHAVVIDGDSFIKADVMVKEGAELLKLGEKLNASIDIGED